LAAPSLGSAWQVSAAYEEAMATLREFEQRAANARRGEHEVQQKHLQQQESLKQQLAEAEAAAEEWHRRHLEVQVLSDQVLH
jgi:beta-galactosidase beta subunit